MTKDQPTRNMVNVRKKDIMERVREQVRCYRSELVDRIRTEGNTLELPGLHVRLAAAFGFCDGVQRAIEIAYATCRMFEGRRIWLIGEIIHNPEVNAQLDALGLLHLPWNMNGEGYERLTPEDVVIIPAFGISTKLRRQLEERGVQLVDSTCGNVIKVWQRVRSYADRGITSIIHGKANHEESMATASQSLGKDGRGQFVVILNESEARLLCEYILGRSTKEAFLAHFRGRYSAGFDPDVHLREMGMANQTTMLKGETTRIQQIIREAVTLRDGSSERFHSFDTICGATQNRQQALLTLLEEPLDTMFIIGGYNSSNTTHLACLSAAYKPTYFVKDESCLLSLKCVRCFDPAVGREVERDLPAEAADFTRTWRVGITAGASCPANVIEGVIRRLGQLRDRGE